MPSNPVALSRRRLLMASAAAAGLAASPPVVQAQAFAPLPRTVDEGELKLWYRNPAEAWVEALPVGNGRLGAMIFGGVARERLQLNEDIGGTEAGRIFEGDRRFDVVVRLPEAARNDPASLAALPIVSSTGVVVPLSSVARIQTAEGPNQISRDNGSRRMVVQANVRGRDLGGFVADAQTRVEQIDLPPGVRLDWGGQFENLKRAEQRLGLVVPIVFILIGVLLFMALGSFAEAGLVFACVPLALVGGALALLLRGMPFSVSAAVGFIAVSGVATLNGLVLMQAVRERLTAGLAPREAAIEGASSRLRAVLTTALVAIVGFIPMAIAHGAGAEVQKPLATVVIGGLLTATALTLLVLPTFAAKAVKHRKAEGIED